MTPGEHGGRDYGRDDDDERYLPSSHSSPSPSYPPRPVGRGRRNGRGDDFPSWAYPDRYQRYHPDPGPAVEPPPRPSPGPAAAAPEAAESSDPEYGRPGGYVAGSDGYQRGTGPGDATRRSGYDSVPGHAGPGHLPGDAGYVDGYANSPGYAGRGYPGGGGYEGAGGYRDRNGYPPAPGPAVAGGYRSGNGYAGSGDGYAAGYPPADYPAEPASPDSYAEGYGPTGYPDPRRFRRPEARPSDAYPAAPHPYQPSPAPPIPAAVPPAEAWPGEEPVPGRPAADDFTRALPGGRAGPAVTERPRRTDRSARAAAADPEAGEDKPRAKRRRLPLWQELPLLLVIAFCLAILIRSFLLQAFFIPSGSMEDTLVAGDRVLANKVLYNFREPERGEIVVFQGTDAWAPLAADEGDDSALAKIGRTFGDLVGVSRPGEKDYIKRVIGVPGDVVSCCDEVGRLLVNGQPINESYVIRDSPLVDAPDGVRDCRGRQFDDVVVEPGHMFVLGDHRQRSQDSRCQGQVPIDNVIGRAFVIVWPNDRWTGLSATDTFASVPAPAASGPAGGLPPEGPGPAGLGLVLPLLPLAARQVGATSSGMGASARSRRNRRRRGRRLAA